jgi:hypothetical protein
MVPADAMSIILGVTEPKSSDAPFPSSMSTNDEYTLTIVQSRTPLSPWGWEVYRNGKPLPARLRVSGFKSKHAARLAGTAALQRFLSDLRHEESKPD